jgi:hypothetical protein
MKNEREQIFVAILSLCIAFVTAELPIEDSFEHNKQCHSVLEEDKCLLGVMKDGICVWPTRNCSDADTGTLDWCNPCNGACGHTDGYRTDGIDDTYADTVCKRHRRYTPPIFGSTCTTPITHEELLSLFAAAGLWELYNDNIASMLYDVSILSGVMHDIPIGKEMDAVSAMIVATLESYSLLDFIAVDSMKWAKIEWDTYTLILRIVNIATRTKEKEEM